MLIFLMDVFIFVSLYVRTIIFCLYESLRGFWRDVEKKYQIRLRNAEDFKLEFMEPREKLSSLLSVKNFSSLMNHACWDIPIRKNEVMVRKFFLSTSRCIKSIKCIKKTTCFCWNILPVTTIEILLHEKRARLFVTWKIKCHHSFSLGLETSYELVELSSLSRSVDSIDDDKQKDAYR